MCKDGSCSKGRACGGATIPYVVGPSCKGGSSDSCFRATIGSVYKSCTDDSSCFYAQLSGVDLINSCNVYYGCYKANGNGEIAELIDCCNDDDYQCCNYDNDLNRCRGEVGRNDIVDAGGDNCVSLTCRTPSDNCFFICQMTHSSLIHNHKYI